MMSNRRADVFLALLMLLAGLSFALRKSINTVLIVLMAWGLVFLLSPSGRRSLAEIMEGLPKDVLIGLLLLASQALLTLLLWPLQGGAFNGAQFGENLRLLGMVPAFFVLQRYLTARHWQWFTLAFAFSIPWVMVEWQWLFAGERFMSRLLNPNTAGIFGGIAFSFFLMLSVSREMTLMGRLSALGAAVGGFWVLIASETRSAWAAALSALLVVGLLRLRTIQQRALTVVAVVGLTLVLGFGVSRIHDRVLLAWTEFRWWMSNDIQETSVGIRLSLFSGAVRFGMEKPMIGHSAQQQRDAVQARGLTDLNQTPASQDMWLQSGVHNHFLDRLITHGLPGALLALLCMLWPAWLFYRGQTLPDRWPSGKTAPCHGEPLLKVGLSSSENSPLRSGYNAGSFASTYRAMLLFGACVSVNLFVNALTLNLGYKYIHSVWGFAFAVSMLAYARLRQLHPSV